MKKYLLMLVFSGLSFLAGAQDVSEQQARDYARRFFSLNGGPATRSSQLKMVWNGEDPQTRSGNAAPAFYVFNRGNGDGFVILSGNRSSRAVLGYAMKGEFSAENLPENVKAWMMALRESVLGKAGQKPEAGAAEAWDRVEDTGKEVDLDTPNWDQDSPYNLKCPVLYGRHCYTGCAVTATAIVMGYHQWPDKGSGTLPGYRTGTNKLDITPIQLGGSYNWAKMPDLNGNWLDLADDAQCEAISTLLYHVGVMARADYDVNGTGAKLVNIAGGLPVYMKYHPKLAYLSRSDYSNEAWARMLREEIDAKRPVIYEGFDEYSGHAIVIDGYNGSGLFNVNWGWGGRYNGFYYLDGLLPGSQGIGGNPSGSYNLHQAGIFGLEPRRGSQEDLDHMQYIRSQSFASGLQVRQMPSPVKKGDSFYVDAGLVRNMGTNVFSGVFKLAMVDSGWNIIETFKSETVSDLHPSQNILVTGNESRIEITQEIKPGYRLCLVYRANDAGPWKPVTCEPDLGKWEYVLCEGEPQPEPLPALDESTAFRYDAQTGQVTVTTLSGAEASLREQLSGTDRSALLVKNGNTFTFYRRQLEKGIYVLTLKKGGETREILLQF